MKQMVFLRFLSIAMIAFASHAAMSAKADFPTTTRFSSRPDLPPREASLLSYCAVTGRLGMARVQYVANFDHTISDEELNAIVNDRMIAQVFSEISIGHVQFATYDLQSRGPYLKTLNANGQLVNFDNEQFWLSNMPRHTFVSSIDHKQTVAQASGVFVRERGFEIDFSVVDSAAVLASVWIPFVCSEN